MRAPFDAKSAPVTTVRVDRNSAGLIKVNGILQAALRANQALGTTAFFIYRRTERSGDDILERAK